MLKQSVLLFIATMLIHPAWAQMAQSRIQFNKNASSIAGMIPTGSEGDYVSASFIPASATHPARYMVKVRITKLTPGQNTRVRVGDEVWIYHSNQDAPMTFKDARGQVISNVENTLFKARATGQVQQSSDSKKSASTTAPPRMAPPAAPAPARARDSVDPNLARSTDRRKTEADFCANGRCSSRALEDPDTSEIQEVTKQINKQLPNASAQSVWASDPLIANYSKNSRVVSMITEAKNRSHKRSQGLCYRYVKTAALRSDMVDYRPPGAKAVQGITDLKEQGWMNLMENPKYKSLIKDPDDAPKGAILVYRNVRNANHPGHIEIKTDHGDKGGYVSDFYRSTDTSLVRRELIGVMIKENP